MWGANSVLNGIQVVTRIHGHNRRGSEVHIEEKMVHTNIQKDIQEANNCTNQTDLSQKPNQLQALGQHLYVHLSAQC